MKMPKLKKICDNCGKLLVSGLYLWYPYLPLVVKYNNESYYNKTSGKWHTFCESCSKKYDEIVRLKHEAK